MNERIKELALEAGFEIEDGGHIMLHHIYLSGRMEKFAKLIVQECMTIVEGFELTQEVALDHYVDYEASAVLKEHFGVDHE